MNRLTEIIQALSQALHLVKPLLFELVLFIWAATELVRFLVRPQSRRTGWSEVT